jgi:formate-dependent nitrite reductase cytochrome c552 subunit
MKKIRARLPAVWAALAMMALWPVFAADYADKVSDRCALCHEEAAKQWSESKHAAAMDDTFRSLWEREGKKLECLVCHTTQFDRQTGKYSLEGITCTSCHEDIGANHPDDKTKSLPVTSQVCQKCHGITFGEWRISGHGQKNIRCFDCHKMHSMAQRKDDPDQMCGTCHTARLESFSHATHATAGLHCTTCHMPETVGHAMKVRGTGVRGHTFGVGAETCTKCHRDMVHASGETAALQAEVKQLKASRPELLERKVADLQQETTQLSHALQANRRIFGPVVAVAFALGLVIGYAMPHLNRKNREGK